jgi:tyrosine-protein phosphatase YwqE
VTYMTVVKSDIHDLHCRHVHNSPAFSLKAIISNVLQLFEFIRNNQFWFKLFQNQRITGSGSLKISESKNYSSFLCKKNFKNGSFHERTGNKLVVL